MKKTKFSSSIDEIKENIETNYPEFYKNEEFPAALSHWRHTPHLCPPLMPEYIFGELINLMYDKLGLRKKKGNIKDGPLVYQSNFQFMMDDIIFPPPKNPEFTFIDLFAGIGGFRIAMQENGGKCVFSSEWDKYAKQTYEANFGEVPYGDIRKIDKKLIPDHDVLCAGFPCQPFSLAGVSKKNSLGKKHGFDDETQGTLFFEIKEILRIKRPKAFMLENVKNLLTHDKRKTFEVIRQALEDDLGYIINWKIVDGSKWVPQHRERIFIVGYNPEKITISKENITIPEKPSNKYVYTELNKIINKKIAGYTLGPGTWDTLERHKKHHAAIGNGFGYGLHRVPIKKGTVTRTISARYHKDGAEILIEQPKQRPRRLTVEEAMQLQGYSPMKFTFPVSKTQAYRQIGNSVVVPAITACATEIAKVLKGKTHDN